MRDYIITVNSTVDTGKEWLKERNVPVIPLKYTIDGQEYTDMYGLSDKEFFQKLREGKMSVTSQINPEEAKEMLEQYVKEGKDVLHLAFSSALSGSDVIKLIADQNPFCTVDPRLLSAFPIPETMLWNACTADSFRFCAV